MQKLEKLSPDVVLCDVVMPVKNGVEFVKEAVKKYEAIVVMLSNYNEFDHVREAFHYGAADYLLKNRVTKESLLECLKNITIHEQNFEKPEMEQSFGRSLRKVLDGYAQSPFLELEHCVEEQLGRGPYCMIYMEKPDHIQEKEAEFQKILQTKLELTPLCAGITSQGRGIGIIRYKGIECSKKRQNMMKKMECEFPNGGCAVSGPFSGWSEIVERAEHLAECAKYTLLFEERTCFWETEVPSQTSVQLSYDSEKFGFYIQYACYQEAKEVILESLEGVKNSFAVYPYQMKKFIEHALYHTYRILRGKSRVGGRLNHLELKTFKQIDQAVSFSDIVGIIERAFREFEFLGKNGEIGNNDSIIVEMRHFLGENYQKQITLNDLAKALHINYSYLSTYITQKTGKHFSEHLNEVRIEKAKRMLQNTDHSLSFISEAIGYADQSYFGKIFKKIVGATPLQYRNSYKKAGKDV